MVVLSDLNDDCLTAILSYLTFVQLFACISSLKLKNKGFYRCALAALKRSYAPFSLEPKFDFDAKQWWLWLADAKDTHLQQVNAPQYFSVSALAASVEKVEIPVYVNFAWGDLNVCLNLTKALPNVKALSIRVLKYPRWASLDISSTFDKLTPTLGALFPKLRSFGVVGLTILPELGINALIEIIRQMPGVVILKIPSYMLKAFLARLPGKANELSELILYRNDNDHNTIACAKVFAAVSEARLAELTHLKYTCRLHHYGLPFVDASEGNSHECIQTFASLQKLRKLHTLTLDMDFGPFNNVSLPRQIDPVDLVSLSELNVTLRFPNFGYQSRRAMWTDSLFRQFINLRTIHIFLSEAHSYFLHVAGAALDHTSTTLREFTVQRTEEGSIRSAEHLPPLLPDDLHDFRQLERIVVTGAEIDLRGFASEGRAKHSNGYPSIAKLINRLKSCRSLKYATLRASVDSPEALKAWLPDNCEIVGVVERPCAVAKKKACLVLHPDKYWRPVEILISAEKDAVSPMNETPNFGLRLIVPQ